MRRGFGILGGVFFWGGEWFGKRNEDCLMDKFLDAIFVLAGLLLVIFNKQMADFTYNYHIRRWARKKKVTVESPGYPQEAVNSSKIFSRILCVIVGLCFVISGAYSLLA